MTQIATYIVQAGGQGSRMEHYTWNKPKCLVPIDGAPLIYHLFSAAPDAQFIVIGDYLFDVLQAYLDTFPPPVQVNLVHTDGSGGTCAGIGRALQQIEHPEKPVGLIWCDLLFDTPPKPECTTKPVIGLSTSFPCRWSVDDKRGIVEEMSFDHGIAGYFAFPNASFLRQVPADGEFVRWLSQTFTAYDTLELPQCHEVGNSAEAMRQWRQRGYARFFNDVRLHDDTVEKRARLPERANKIVEEADWYEEASRLGFRNIPKLIAREPLTLSRIHGVHPDEINLKPRQKHELMERLFTSLKSLHALGSIPANDADCFETYISKTIQRVEKVLPLIPERNTQFFTINGKRCYNPFGHGGDLQGLIGKISHADFTFLHGDPTFANTLVDKSSEIFLIDPRVMFGKTKYYGDADYDWAKLYYSAIGNYDAFNRRQFRLVVWENTVSLDIESLGFAFTKPLFREHLGEARFRKVELLHALIWLSLAGWVDDDVDSIIAAFYNGLYWLEEWASA